MTGGINSSSFALSHVIYCHFFTSQCSCWRAVQFPVLRNGALALARADAAGSLPPFSLEGMCLWCIQLGSQLARLFMFPNNLHHQKLFLSACDRAKIQERKLRKKKNHKQPRRKDKINPPTEEESSELIYFDFQLTLRFSNLLTMKSTSNLGWGTRSQTFFFFFNISRIYIYVCTGDL